ncbi:MAG: hypothetical protein ACRD4H_05280, partial [Candidatus Acidiferrales bacterium]
GLKLTSAASGGGFTIALTSSNANEAATWNLSLGTSAANIGTPGSGSLQFKCNNTSRYTITNSGATHTWTATANVANGIGGHFVFTAPADTANTAGTNTVQMNLDMSAIRQHASNTAVTADYGIQVKAPTFAYATSGGVTTTAATVDINGAPIGGTNATITNSAGLQIESNALSNVTNGFGLIVAAPSGATNNFSMKVSGQVLRAGSAPSVAAGAGAGTSPTGPTMAGTTQAGTITVTTGTSCTGSNATIATITFGTAWPTGSSVTLTPGNNNAAALADALQVYGVGGMTTWLLKSGATALVDATQYIWNYEVSGY